jgi:hypothetical protein
MVRERFVCYRGLGSELIRALILCECHPNTIDCILPCWIETLSAVYGIAVVDAVVEKPGREAGSEIKVLHRTVGGLPQQCLTFLPNCNG